MANPEHLAKLKEGVEAWNKWREKNPKINPDLEHAHLFQAHLEHAHLYDAHLEHAVLIGAHLEHAFLRGVHLEHAFLRGANLERAYLFDAHLEHADLKGANFEHASLSSARLEGTNLSGTNLTSANVTGLLYLGPAATARLCNWLRNPPIPDRRQAKHIRFWLRAGSRLVPYRHRVMRGRYQGIFGLSSCRGNRIFVRDASDQDYLDTMESQLTSTWGRFWFRLWGLIDYGRSFMSVVVVASMLIFIFGKAYSHWPKMITLGGRCPTPFTPYYFSIVTYTTLGFGDVKPHNLAGEVLVSFEVILGYVTLGLLLAVLGDRIARRS